MTRYIIFPVNATKTSIRDEKGKLIPSYKITFKKYSPFYPNNNNVGGKDLSFSQVNTNQKVRTYAQRKLRGQKFNNVYRNLESIYEVVNENGSFSNSSTFQKIVNSLSSTNSNLTGFKKSKIINAKNGNSKRKKILSNFLTRYAS